MEGRVDYHVMDDAAIADEEEEMLDEDEIRERNAHMLRELQEKIEREEGPDALK